MLYLRTPPNKNDRQQQLENYPCEKEMAFSSSWFSRFMLVFREYIYHKSTEVHVPVPWIQKANGFDVEKPSGTKKNRNKNNTMHQKCSVEK